MSKEAGTSFIVYADECYHQSWIYPEVTQKIVDYLTSNNRKEKKFQVLDAKRLKDWMNSKIENGEAYKTVVVFAQDMVPDILAPDFSPSILMRTYLDAGGRIVWLGDVPFFRQGKYCENLQQTLANEGNKGNAIWTEWGISGIFSVLGVNVEFNYSPYEKIEITKEGKEWGLRDANKWYGTRPITEEKDGIKVLAKSSAKRFKPPELIKPEEKKSVFDTFSDTVNKISLLSGIILSFITALLAYFSLIGLDQLPKWLTDLSKYLPVEILPIALFIGLSVFSISLPKIYNKYKKWKRKKYPNAWIKNFNKEYPDSGFVRLWDQQLYDIKEEALKDLFMVATNYL